MPTQRIIVAASALVMLASLSACDGKPADRTDALDNELVNGIAGADSDAALTSALGNQIVVDPARAGARKNAPGVARPTLGALAKVQADRRAGAAPRNECERYYRYDVAWAGKMPAAAPLYPGAKVTEAAGTDQAGCRIRIVSFASAAPVEKILDFYRGAATRAGYSADREMDQGDHVLAGTLGDGAYYLMARPAKGGGSTADLIANR